LTPRLTSHWLALGILAAVVTGGVLAIIGQVLVFFLTGSYLPEILMLLGFILLTNPGGFLAISKPKGFIPFPRWLAFMGILCFDIGVGILSVGTFVSLSWIPGPYIVFLLAFGSLVSTYAALKSAIGLYDERKFAQLKVGEHGERLLFEYSIRPRERIYAALVIVLAVITVVLTLSDGGVAIGGVIFTIYFLTIWLYIRKRVPETAAFFDDRILLQNKGVQKNIAYSEIVEIKKLGANLWIWTSSQVLIKARNDSAQNVLLWNPRKSLAGTDLYDWLKYKTQQIVVQ